MLLLAGCGGAAPVADAKGKTGGATVAKADPKPEAKTETAHSGWWCAEHGIPEEECSMCSAKVAKECKAKGDWCDKHDRAKSQCFLCDPKLKEKYAAVYRAKLGMEPPPTEDDQKKNEKKS
jgi:hypothetical protein